MSVTEILDSSDSDFVMFTTNVCPYCNKAKNFLKAKGLSFDEHNVSVNRDLQMEVVKMTGHRTVPAIWDVRGDEPVFVGGSDNLEDLL
jgi:glutaredoxin 3